MGSGSPTSVLFCDLVASSTNIQVPFRRLPGRFLEGMKHVNRVAELRHVKDAVLITALFDTDLICPGPDRLHWLKICRLFASLDLVKLEACLPAGIFRKRSSRLAPTKASSCTSSWSILYWGHNPYIGADIKWSRLLSRPAEGSGSRLRSFPPHHRRPGPRERHRLLAKRRRARVERVAALLGVEQHVEA